VLEFAYDIVAGDFAPAGIVAAGEIDLAGGAIRDAAGNPLTLTFTPPDLSGVKVQTYRAAWTTDPVTAANASAAAFQITKPPPGASFAWQITSNGGGTLSGSGTIAASPHPVTGLDLTALADGTLTLSVTLTTPAGTGAARTATVAKATNWCDDPSALASASPGAACADGSIYAGSLSGKHLITHVSGCGYEPSGTGSTKPSAAFTPTCTGGTDSITKQWGSVATEGAISLTDGRLNTNQLLADAQGTNPAAAYCQHLNLHGKTDWYLPAQDEFDLLYQRRAAIGGFASAVYWTSSESNSDRGWSLEFGGGSKQGRLKGQSERIRCIRTTAPPPPAPSVYGVAWTSDLGVPAGVGAASFQITGAEVGAAFSYAVTSSGGGGSARGAGAVTTTTQSVSGLNLWVLPDGVLTLSVVLTNAGGSGAAAMASGSKIIVPIDCTDPALLATAPNGARCLDGAIYAGTFNGRYIATTETQPTPRRWDSEGCYHCGGDPAATGISSMDDGRLNIAAMRAWVEGNTARGDLNGFDAARYCDDLSAHGRSDWYLPAYDEQMLL
jgi:hypothetical protein